MNTLILAHAEDPTLQTFRDDVWWITLIKLFGVLRSSAQMISYEVAMGLSIVAVFMTAGTLSTSQIVKAQAGGDPTGVSILGWHPTAPSWYAVLLLPSFVIYCIAAVGETNRAPFDLPEAESELVGGFHTE